MMPPEIFSGLLTRVVGPMAIPHSPRLPLLYIIWREKPSSCWVRQFNRNGPSSHIEPWRVSPVDGWVDADKPGFPLCGDGPSPILVVHFLILLVRARGRRDCPDRAAVASSLLPLFRCLCKGWHTCGRQYVHGVDAIPRLPRPVLHCFRSPGGGNPGHIKMVLCCGISVPCDGPRCQI